MLTTIKIRLKTRLILRLIAEITHESMVDVMDRVLREEALRVLGDTSLLNEQPTFKLAQAMLE